MSGSAKITMTTNVAEQVQLHLDVEIIPGTEILTDVENSHFIHGGRQGVVLVPQPTMDPHDPLVRKKETIVLFPNSHHEKNPSS